MVNFITKTICMALISALCAGSLNAQFRGDDSDTYAVFGAQGMVFKGTVANPADQTTGVIGMTYCRVLATEYVDGLIYAVARTFPNEDANKFGTIDMTDGSWINIKDNFGSDGVSLCYNPVDGKVYVAPYTGSNSKSGVFGTVNLATGEVTTITTFPLDGNHTYFMAIDNDGIAYAVPNLSNQFGTIDLATGAFTQTATLPFTVADGFQNMSVDRETNEIYWLARTDSGNAYYKVDKNGTTTFILTPTTVVDSFCIITDYVNDNTPVAPTDFTVSPSCSALTAHLAWTNPALTVGGNPLTGIDKIVVERDGIVVKEFDNPAPGGAMSFTDNTITDMGMYAYSVYAVTSEGMGVKANASVIVGNMCSIKFILKPGGWAWLNASIGITVDGVSYGTVTGHGYIDEYVIVLISVGEVKFTYTPGDYSDDAASFQIYNYADELIFDAPQEMMSSLHGEFFTWQNDCGGGTYDPVSNLTGEFIAAEGEVKLVWTSPAGITGCDIYRDGDRIAQVGTAGTYTDDASGLEAGEHEYCVVAVYSDCEAGAVCVTLSLTPCNAATALKVEIAEDPCAATLSWTAAADMPDATYNIYRDGEKIATVPETEYVDHDLEANTEHTWTVKTICADGEATGTDAKGGCGVGIAEHETAAIAVYPNPTDGQLIVECRDAINGVSTMTTITNIEIFDIFGRNVSHPISHISHPIFIDISHLPAGMYFVRITTETGVVVRKIIKQ